MAKPVKYSFSYIIKVAWGEMDAFGHVNNVTYARYFESARAEYFTALAIWNSPLQPSSGGPLLTHLNLDYRKQVVFPADLDVTMEVTALTSRGFQIHTSMWNKDNECVVTGEAGLIWYDFQTGRPATLPKIFRENFPNL
ncbi:acyl-CoA thioesterase [Leptospira sp. GIMC2001]|uniref:acyl-CoA thioesterase n=1 Tax=Leptospira sp. GIMC2001 TaxID=1513297 RepID=UPI002349823A|nr:acyl-CoA thioesterase [Leptospira sp. GIMC2001]WCL49133.1 acyl-CoA thioesterase [Leptospira sp. GIMC2001]